MLAERPDKTERLLVPLAMVTAAVMFVFPLAISFPLLDPDEGLHASIAQEMVEQNNWTTPRLLGEPFLDKPIFYFWMQAASIWLFGPCEAAVRLPGLMFGLLGAATTGLLAGRMFHRKMGLIAGILYATTILPTAMAQAASHDVAIIPWVNLSLLLLWEAEHALARKATIACAVGAGVFLGLAILTKGLPGPAIVGVAYGGYLLLTRQVNLAMLIEGVAVLAIALLVASPWYVWVESQNPGYLRYFLLERHVLGFTTDSQPHGDSPWWYYLPVLLGGGLPWIGYLPIVVQDRLAGRRGSNATVLLWCWLIGGTLLVMLAGSKLATYLLPVFPALAILAATAWSGLIDGTLSELARRSFARTFIGSSWTGPIVLPAVVFALQPMLGVWFSWPVWVAVGLAAAIAPLPLAPWRVGRWNVALAAAVLSLVVQFTVVMTVVLPPLAETFSARQLARHFNRLGNLPPRLLIVEGRIGSVVFYLDPRLRAELTPQRLQQWSAEGLPALHLGDVLAVSQRKIANLRKYFDVNNTPSEQVGYYRLYRVVKPQAVVGSGDGKAAGRSVKKSL